MGTERRGTDLVNEVAGNGEERTKGVSKDVVWCFGLLIMEPFSFRLFSHLRDRAHKTQIRMQGCVSSGSEWISRVYWELFCRAVNNLVAEL